MAKRRRRRAQGQGPHQDPTPLPAPPPHRQHPAPALTHRRHGQASVMESTFAPGHCPISPLSLRRLEVQEAGGLRMGRMGWTRLHRAEPGWPGWRPPSPQGLLRLPAMQEVRKTAVGPKRGTLPQEIRSRTLRRKKRTATVTRLIVTLPKRASLPGRRKAGRVETISCTITGTLGRAGPLGLDG